MTSNINNTKLKVRQIETISPPMDCKVIYMNDDVTTFDFVSGSLVNFFEYDPKLAQDKSVEINNKGSGIVAVLPYEIAEQKGVEVLISARTQGFPMEIKLETAWLTFT